MRLRRVLRDERGQTLVCGALAIGILMGMVALAVDAGMLLHERRIMQTAADSAAMAGAAELGYGDATSAAQADAAQNGVPTSAVTVNNGPASGPHKNNSAYVEVLVSQSEPTLFMSVLNRTSMTVTTRAVATNVPNPDCVVSTGVSSPGVSLSNGAALTLSGCGLYDDTSGSGALTLSGGASITASAVDVVGTITTSHGASKPSGSKEGVTALPDPLSSKVTAPPASDYSSGCSAESLNNSNNGQSIGPSSSSGYVCYSSFSITNSPTITLKPGLYIITGAMTIGGGAIVNGTGVTFYFVNSGSFSFSNGATLTLSAPTSGNYNSLLFYQDSKDTNADSFVGGSSGSLNGIFYLPSAALTLSNGASGTFNVDLVVGSLTMTGGASLKPYIPLNGASLLATPRLAE